MKVKNLTLHFLDRDLNHCRKKSKNYEDEEKSRGLHLVRFTISAGNLALTSL